MYNITVIIVIINVIFGSQIGIQDVFYRYRADLSFMSPDARLFVNSVHQVVSVTAKKYNTPPGKRENGRGSRCTPPNTYL